MSAPERYAVLLDGGFVKRKLQEQTKTFPTAADVVNLVEGLKKKERLASGKLPRVYYYDAPPLDGSAKNPIDGYTINFSGTKGCRAEQSLD